MMFVFVRRSWEVGDSPASGVMGGLGPFLGGRDSVVDGWLENKWRETDVPYRDR